MHYVAESKSSFSSYVYSLRKKRGLTLEALCEGLCNPAKVYYWEGKNRIPELLMQERILGRLGVGIGGFQHLLAYDKYQEWHRRLQIVFLIREGKYAEAATKLKQYEEKADLTQVLEKQFCLRMRSYILENKGVDKTTLYEIVNQAVKLTVPEIDERPLESFALDAQELDLILDRNRLSPQVNRTIFEDVINYTMEYRFEQSVQAKIYPKATALLCQFSQVEEGKLELRQLHRLLMYIDRALDILRHEKSMYYIWEILRYRKSILYQIGHLVEENTNLENIKAENQRWLDAIENVYTKYKFPKQIKDSANLYIVRGVECINDIIRIRRKMLGLSQEELCDGICSERSLQRIERKGEYPQKYVLEQLCARLGIPTEETKGEIIINSLETKDVLDKVRKAMLGNNRNELDRNLSLLQDSIDMENTYNKQYISYIEAMSLAGKGIYGKKQLAVEMKKILEMSVPWDSIFWVRKRYYTYNELIYIYNIVLGMDHSDKECFSVYAMLRSYYQSIIRTEMSLGVRGYRFVLNIVQNYYGNIGMYAESNKFNRAGMKECMLSRYAGLMIHFHYGLIWNNMRQKKKTYSNQSLDMVEDVRECAALADLFYFESEKKFFEDEIGKLEVNR